MQDKRQHRRIPFEHTVLCTPETGPEFECRAHDLSLGGMFISADCQPKFGDKLRVTLSLPGHTKPLELPATVRWVRPDGFGVQFGLLGARETHAITRLSLVPPA